MIGHLNDWFRIVHKSQQGARALRDTAMPSIETSQTDFNHHRANESTPSEQGSPLTRVQELLDAGHADKALALLAKESGPSLWLKNAIGVCQMRLGNAESAVDLFRQLALGPGGVCLRLDAPTVFKTNLATALLMARNVSGCLSILAQINEEQNGTVQRLRAGIKRWKSTLSVWRRLQLMIGSRSDRPVVLDFPLGELWIPNASG